MLVLDGGDLIWKTARTSDKRIAQQQRKGQLQLWSLTSAGIDGMVPGQGDLAMGLDWLQDQAREFNAPYTAANLVCNGERPFPASQSAELDGLAITIIGILSEQDTVPKGCSVLPPAPAVTAVLDSAPAADLVVVLSRQDVPADELLAEAVPRIDFIVGGGGNGAMSQPRLLPNRAARVEVGTRGKKVGVAKVHWLPDATGFTVANAADDIEAELRRMQKRRQSAVDHRDRSDDEKSRERQQRRVEHYDEQIPKLEAELATARAQATTPGHTIELELRGLGDAIADHPETLEKVGEALQDIEKMESAGNSSRPLRGPYMGSSACAACHPAQTTQWKTTDHSHAWQTLIDQRRHMDLDCYSCHVTGAFHAEGPTHPNQVGQLQDVGCEACHGPGRDHVRDPTTARMVADPPQSTCIQCHDGDQDEGRFDFDTYRPKVVHQSLPPAP